MSIKRIYQNIHISFSELSTIFALAFIIRVLNILLIDDFQSHSFVEDSPIYWNGARYWIDSGFFSNISHVGYVAETERVPLYHLFLIFFQIIFGNEILPLLLGQVFVDSASCVLIAKLGSYLSRQIGIISGICAAFSINLILHSSLILSETLFLFLMAVFLLRCVNYIYRPSSYNVAIIGFICGCAIMTRTVSLLIPLAIFIALPAISSYLGKGWKSGVLAGITLLFFSIIPTTPIIYRNITNFDTLQLTSQTGTHFFYWVVGNYKVT
jgi:4-amino-4-deoxy-L-arabinose transferase-like glycosyltransferase